MWYLWRGIRKENNVEFEKEKARFSELGPLQTRELGTAFYDSIYYSVTGKLGQVQGRKAILIFRDGEAPAKG